MQGDDVQSDDVWRWRPDAVSSEEPRTVSSLDPRGGGEALMARQVGRRSYRAKAAVRRDELGGASMQPSTATPSGKLLCHPWSLVVVELFSSPILSPREFTFYPFFLHIRNYLKVCPNLLLSVFPDQGLDCYVLDSSRVFSVRFPELSLFQIDELLHFIDFHTKFIKM
jgi:hypothetical protein